MAAKQVNIRVGDQVVSIKGTDDVPVSISYQLEDTEDFQKKTSSQSLNIKIPATPENDSLGNTFHNPGIEDLTEGEVFKSAIPSVIEAGGTELLVGKSFLNNVGHTDKPEYYERSFFGNNADWIIDLKEATLFDFIKHISFTFNSDTIINSWAFDGSDPDMPYVFAPVKYGGPIGGYKTVDGEQVPVNDNMAPEYMRPAISKYWLIRNAFASMGYRIQSEFMETEYFKRQVLPWTWGNFLNSEGTKYDIHRFRAASPSQIEIINFNGSTFIDVNVTNDLSAGNFDNNNTVPNGDYTYDPVNYEMKWTYNTPHFGPLDVTLSNQTFFDAYTVGGSIVVKARWYKNGVQVSEETILNVVSPFVDAKSFVGTVDSFFSTSVNNGDTISCKLFLTMVPAAAAILKLKVTQHQLDFFRVPIGGTISFDSYTGLKKARILDLLRGVTDEFNLLWQTDPITKTVIFEPAHPYSLDNNLAIKQGGYFNENFIDWSEKQDISKESSIELFKDYEREVMIRYKDDSSDGIMKKLNDRHQTTIGAAKYVFPERFKSGSKVIENRFFAPVAHCDIDDWKELDGKSKQMVALVPENISNTSASEAENTFLPRSCYYKGLISGYSWRFNGEVLTSYPFMFAVNYMTPGGEDDPILSYSDENINGVVGKGLLRRFFLQRFAIMRNGQWYNTWLRLNNNDVANVFHREHKLLRGQRWELIRIDQYKPLDDESTKCLLRKWTPISVKDSDATYPSISSVQDGTLVTSDQYDTKYAIAKCLNTDIPKF